jgi:hypothetical protein
MKALRRPGRLLIALLSLAAFGPLHAEILGFTQPGAIPSSGLSSNFKRGSKFTLTEAATATLLCAHLDGNGGASGSQQIRMVLYRDANGVPGAKVVESRVHTITAGDPTQRWCPEIAFTSLTPATYWIVLHSAGAPNVGRYFNHPGTNWYGNNDTYSDGASNPFGAGAAGTGVMSVALVYIPARQMSVAGRTTVGALPSKGLTADYKRGSSLTMPVTGRVSSLNAYIDVFGSAGVSQSIRLALYKDENGVPGGKVLESVEKTFTANYPPTWVPFETPTIVIPAGKYWIVIHSGATGGLVRDYADGTGNWFGNADTYDDGASNSFGTPSAGNGTLSAYVAYVPGPFSIIGLSPASSSGTPSKGLTANFSRGTKLSFYAERASLHSLTALLDGYGGAGGSQDVRMAVYKDNNDSPGELFATSGVVSIPAGSPAQWLLFPFKPMLIPAGSYWLVIHSGGTGGVVRNYGSSTFASWRGADDNFANGPANPFGAEGSGIGVGTVNLLVGGTLMIPITN